MPIGTGIIYNVGDLILSQVSGSGTAFLETKIAAATSSLIYFDSTAKINSASLNSITVGTASYVSGSTSIITNLTASNISASGTGSFGMVGIGTTLPSVKLDVVGSAAISSTLTVTGTTALNGAVNLSLAGTPTVTLGASTTYGVLTATGTNAASIYLNGATRTGFESKLQFGAAEHQWFNGSLSSQIMTLNTTGLGIGTTSPAAKLDLYNGTDLGSGANGIRVQRPGSYGQYGYLEYLVSSDQTVLGSVYTGGGAARFGQFYFRQHSSTTSRDAMVINDSGNVGIGTTAPGTALHVAGVGFIGRQNTRGSYDAADADLLISNYNSDNTSILLFNSAGAYHSSLINYYNNILSLGLNNSNSTNSILTSTAINITSTGVGIGTPSPNDLLQLQASSSIAYDATSDNGQYGSGAGITITNMDETSQSFAQVNLQVSGNSGRALGRIVAIRTASATSDLAFVTENANTKAEKMRILSDGNVGIGTTAPGARLEVYGTSGDGIPTFKVTSTAAASTFNWAGTILNSSLGSSRNYILLIGKAASSKNSGYIGYNHSGTDGSDTNFLTFGHYGSDNLLNILGNGLVGIGTTSPSAKLEIVGFSTGAGLKLNYGNSSGTIEAVNFIANGAANGVIGMQMVSAGVGDLWLGGSGGRILTLYRDGNVGIGTSSPAYKLDVSGDLRISGSGSTVGTFKSSASSCFISLIDSSNDNVFLGNDDGDFLIQTPTSGYSTKLIVKDDGNVGIGTTSPAQLLELKKTTGSVITILNYNDSVKFNINASSTGAGYVGMITNHPLIFVINDAEKVRVDTSGNVGIGVSAPNTKLTVWTPSTTGVQTALRLNNPFGFANANTGTKIVFSQDRTAAEDIPMSEMGVGQEYAGTSAAGYMFFSTLNNSMGERMRINSVGNVGIGTTNPGAKLQVDVSSASGIRVNGTGGYANILSQGGHLEFYKDSTPTYAAAIGLSTPATALSNDIQFATYNGSSWSARMTIANGGNVGIGTTSPVAALDVSRLEYPSLGGVLANFSAGTTDPTTEKYVILRQTYTGALFDSPMLVFKANANSANSGSFGIVRTTSNGSIVFSNVNATSGTVTAVSEKMRITADGNVGIGTTSPTGTYGKLSVAGGIRILDDNNAKLEIGRYSSGASNSYIKLGSNSNSLRITNNTDAADIFTIENGGNVGIGTSSPVTQLHVSGSLQIGNGTNYGNKFTLYDDFSSGKLAYVMRDLNSDDIFGLYCNSTTGEVRFLADDDDANTAFMTFQMNGSERMRITNAGNVGIGTTNPLKNLQINAITASIRLEESSAGSKRLEFSIDSSAVAKISANQSGQQIAFETVGTERIRIAADGNVGIGTSSPAYKLEVSGSSRFTGTITGGNNIELIKADGPYVLVGEGTGVNQYGVMDWDATNNILRLATQPYAFGANGGQINLTTSGNVGIGTTSPAAKLYVVSSGGPIARFDGSSVASSGATEIDVLGPQSNGDLNLGIGGSTLTDATNNIQNKAFVTAGTGLSGLNLRSDAGYVQITAGGLASSYEVARFTSAGNVGIGTTSPIVKLQVVGATDNSFASAYTGNPALIALYGTDDYNSGTAGGGVFFGGKYDSSNNSTAFATISGIKENSTNANFAGAMTFMTRADGSGATVAERMRITSTGAVGIGLTNPNTKLQVSGSATIGGYNAFYYGTGVTSLNITAPLYPVLAFYYGTTLAGIVTGYSDHIGLNTGAGGSKYISFEPGDSEIMRITAAGNVGIGTSTPLFKLDNYNDTFRSLSRVSEKIVSVGFDNAIANQKVDITFDVTPGTNVFWGNLEVEITDGYNNQNATGKLIKVFAVGLNPATGAGPYGSAIYDNTSYYTAAYGDVVLSWAIDGIFFNTTTGKYYFTVIHRTSTGNSPVIKIKGYTVTPAQSDSISKLTAGSVYTTDTTVYYKAAVETAQSRIGYNGNINQSGDLIVQGNVGIGTTSPTAPLHVVGVISGSSFTGAGTGLTGTAASLTAGAVTNGVYTTGAQSVGGVKSFTSTMNVTGVRETMTTVAAATNVAINLNLGTIFKLTFSSTVSTFTITNTDNTNVAAGNSFTLISAPDNSNAKTIAFSFITNGAAATAVKWAGGTTPTATITSGKFDVFSFVYDGVNWYGFTGGLTY